MNINEKLISVAAFAIGIFSADIVNAADKLYRRLSEKAVVITAEQYQRDFYNERRKAMGSYDDH